MWICECGEEFRKEKDLLAHLDAGCDKKLDLCKGCNTIKWCNESNLCTKCVETIHSTEPDPWICPECGYRIRVYKSGLVKARHSMGCSKRED